MWPQGRLLKKRNMWYPYYRVWQDSIMLHKQMPVWLLLSLTGNGGEKKGQFWSQRLPWGFSSMLPKRRQDEFWGPCCPWGSASVLVPFCALRPDIDRHLRWMCRGLAGQEAGVTWWGRKGVWVHSFQKGTAKMGTCAELWLPISHSTSLLGRREREAHRTQS